jgi:hypothetical protein
MKREDFNLIAALLFNAINEGEAEPRIALRFAAALARHEGPAFQIQDFVNRCVPIKRRAEVGKIKLNKEAPPEKEKSPVLIEDDAALFTAILAVEFPRLSGVISCALTKKQQARFTIGRVGGRVWIRFGGQALEDPVAAVRAAAPDAEAMANHSTTAREIRG